MVHDKRRSDRYLPRLFAAGSDDRLKVFMHCVRFLSAQIGLGILICVPAAATNLVTGNGFGFAVVSPETATVSKFYAHPYSFVRPDPKNPLGEGVETANFIKSLGWSAASAEYEERVVVAVETRRKDPDRRPCEGLLISLERCRDDHIEREK